MVEHKLETAVCSLCRVEKPVSEFGKNKVRRKNGDAYYTRRWACKPCASNYVLAWFKKRCAEDPVYAARRKEYHRRHSYEYYRRLVEPLRQEMYRELGDCCSCCGESRVAFLTLEHVGRWGKRHRQKLGTLAYVLRDAKRMGWPKDKFAVLCHNCNQATRFGDPCPHKTGKNEHLIMKRPYRPLAGPVQ